jgi:hypothetical protein
MTNASAPTSLIIFRVYGHSQIRFLTVSLTRMPGAGEGWGEGDPQRTATRRPSHLSPFIFRQSAMTDCLAPGSGEFDRLSRNNSVGVCVRGGPTRVSRRSAWTKADPCGGLCFTLSRVLLSRWPDGSVRRALLTLSPKGRARDRPAHPRGLHSPFSDGLQCFFATESFGLINCFHDPFHVIIHPFFVRLTQ